MTYNYIVGDQEYFIIHRRGVCCVIDDYCETYFEGTYNQCVAWLDYEHILQLERMA